MKKTESPADEDPWKALKQNSENRASPLFLVGVFFAVGVIGVAIYYFYQSGGIQI